MTAATRRAWRIVLGFNLPWILWTAYALWIGLAGTGAGVGMFCPVDSLVGICPACGLTGAYADLLTGQAAPSLRLTVILVAFVVNAIGSVVRARKVYGPAGEQVVHSTESPVGAPAPADG